MATYSFPKQAARWLSCALLSFVCGCPSDITLPKKDNADSVALFAEHLHQKLIDYGCGNCHAKASCDPDPYLDKEGKGKGKGEGEGKGAPLYIDCKDVEKSHDMILPKQGIGKVNLDSPQDSRIASKVVGPPPHHCPPTPTCDVVANNFIAAVKKWRDGLGNADASAKIIQTEYRDISDLTNTPTEFDYNLDLLVGQAATLSVNIHKTTDDTAYFIDGFEIKSNNDIYVKNIGIVLNNTLSNNFSSTDCVLKPNKNLSDKFTQVPIGGPVKQAERRKLAVRFEQLRLATPADGMYCGGGQREQQEPANGSQADPTNATPVTSAEARAIIRANCLGSGCHNNGTQRTPLVTDDQIIRAKVNVKSKIMDGTMPPPEGNFSPATAKGTLLRWLNSN